MPPELAQLGFAGLVIAVLAGVVVKLYNKIDSIQESRIQDARETRDKLGDQMEVNNKTMQLIYDKIQEKKGN